MKEIALHLLDLAENSVSAGADTIQISVREDLDADRLTTRIEDNGCGMDDETMQKVINPFFTSRTTRKIGLGIPLLKEAAEACQGNLTISSKPGTGTIIEASFQHSHVDRMPLGNLPITFLELTVAHPEVHWIFQYSAQREAVQEAFEFDDAPVKEILGEVSLTHPDVLAYLRETLEQGLGNVKQILSFRPVRIEIQA